MHLDIIVRTCSKRSVDNNGKKRIVNESRSEMIIKCLDSLIKSANNCKRDITIKVLDDHSDDAFMIGLGVVCNKSVHPVTIELLEGEGFNNSAYQQFLAGVNCKELVYFVEDDYFHTEDAIEAMMSFWESGVSNDYKKFNAMTITPYDCPHRYWPTLIEPTLLFYQGNRYWRTVKHTSNTIMIHSIVLNSFFKIFENLALGYPAVKESDTINFLYSDLVNHGGPIACFSPIPSVAYHMSYENEPPNDINTKHTSWKEEWDSYKWL